MFKVDLWENGDRGKLADSPQILRILLCIFRVEQFLSGGIRSDVTDPIAK